jgi:ATP-binding cassette subfamily F protein uup
LRQKKQYLSDQVNIETKDEKSANKNKPVAKIVTTENQHVQNKGKARKLSYKEQRELEELPVRIETLETEQSKIQQTVSSANFYQQDKETIASTLSRLEEIEKELERCFQRWETLEENGGT